MKRIIQVAVKSSQAGWSSDDATAEARFLQFHNSTAYQ